MSLTVEDRVDPIIVMLIGMQQRQLWEVGIRKISVFQETDSHILLQLTSPLTSSVLWSQALIIESLHAVNRQLAGSGPSTKELTPFLCSGSEDVTGHQFILYTR